MSTVSALQRLPFPAALALLGAGTGAGVYVFVRTSQLLWLVIILVIVGAFAVAYLREYAELPGPPETDPYLVSAPRPAAATRVEVTPPRAVGSEPAGRTADTGPVEQDTFDPSYDPVAEADELESRSPRPPPTEP